MIRDAALLFAVTLAFNTWPTGARPGKLLLPYDMACAEDQHWDRHCEDQHCPLIDFYGTSY